MGAGLSLTCCPSAFCPGELFLVLWWISKVFLSWLQKSSGNASCFFGFCHLQCQCLWHHPEMLAGSLSSCLGLSPTVEVGREPGQDASPRCTRGLLTWGRVCRVSAPHVCPPDPGDRTGFGVRKAGSPILQPLNAYLARGPEVAAWESVFLAAGWR